MSFHPAGQLQDLFEFTRANQRQGTERMNGATYLSQAIRSVSVYPLRLISHVMLTNENGRIGACPPGLFALRGLFLALPSSFLVAVGPFAGKYPVLKFPCKLVIAVVRINLNLK